MIIEKGIYINLNRAKERNQKRNAEVYHKAVEDGNDDILLPGRLRDDGQGSIHGSGTARRDRSEIAEPPDHERSA